MKRVLFFLLMIFVSFGVIADCEIQAKDHDCFTIFAKGTIFSAFPVLNNKAMWRWYQNEDIGEYYWQTELGTCKNNKFTPSGARLLIRVGSLRLNENHAIKGTLQEGNDSNLLIVFYVQIMPDDFVMQLHRF